MPRPELIAIVGATATGKTTLAIELARRLGGEIISADSRQIYRHMDIGTAKPTADQRAAARHWLIDVADPDEQYTLALFLDGATAAINDIVARRRVPIVAGGTGQYVWALLEAWDVPRVKANPALRAELEARAAREGGAALFDELQRIDPRSADTIDPRNIRRVMRAIEVTLATGLPFSAGRARGEPTFDQRVIGLHLERALLYAHIDRRVEVMIEAGLVEEVRSLVESGYGCSLPSMQSIGYREICGHLRGELTLSEATDRIKTETHRLARMQRAWFREDDPRISWLKASEPALVSRALTAVEGDTSTA